MTAWLILSLILGGSPMNAIALNDLPTGRTFPVTVTGQVYNGEISGQPCVYSEWVEGEKNGRGWVHFRSGAPSVRELQIHTPYGTVTLNPIQLRLYLGPHVSQLGATPPTWVEEYCLEPNRTYHAQVEVETFYLPPPSPGEQPERSSNTVLGLSDVPWKDGKPLRPLTPRGQQHTY